MATVEKRILICGDRDWTDAKAISYVIKAMMSYPKNVLYKLIVIEGDARGADRIAGSIARTLGIILKEYPAHWSHTKDCEQMCKKLVGPPAGPIRNQQMLDEEKPEIVFAFHDDIEKSKGTADMIKRSVRAGLIVWLIRHSPEGLQIHHIAKLPISSNETKPLVQVSWWKPYNKEGIKEV